MKVAMIAVPDHSEAQTMWITSQLNPLYTVQLFETAASTLEIAYQPPSKETTRH